MVYTAVKRVDRFGLHETQKYTYWIGLHECQKGRHRIGLHDIKKMDISLVYISFKKVDRSGWHECKKYRQVPYVRVNKIWFGLHESQKGTHKYNKPVANFGVYFTLLNKGSGRPIYDRYQQGGNCAGFRSSFITFIFSFLSFSDVS